jgi:hypothetical protein
MVILAFSGIALVSLALCGSGGSVGASSEIVNNISGTSESSVSGSSYSYVADPNAGTTDAVVSSSLAIDAEVDGAVAGYIPTSGSWGWGSLGGNAASNAFQVKDDLGRVHTLVKGTNNGLWDNVDGAWQNLGGFITSDPFAVADNLGKIHVLVRGADGALWDRILDDGWVNLGGSITSNPCATLSANNHILVAVKNAEGSLWLKDLTTGSWSSLGGNIISSPQAILDSNGKLHILARGGSGALWDNVDGVWQNLGGSITSDAKPVINPFDTKYLYIFVRGEDGALWRNDLDTTTNTISWHGLGGFISKNNDGLNDGNPAPAVDPDGIIHIFIRGGAGTLWDNANSNWYDLGGSIKSDPNALRDKNGKVRAEVVGGDNSLWVNTLGLYQPSTSLVGPIACDYKKIQPAVDAARTGGEINVMSGTYLENVVIENYNKLKLTIRGAGSGKTIVDGQNAGSTFKIGIWDTSTEATLSGMTIRGGSGNPVLVGPDQYHNSGGGIFIQLAKVDLMDCVLSGNNADDGGGIYNFKGIVNLERTSIDNNNAISYGGGVLNYGTLNLNGGSISHNNAFHGGAVLSYGTFNMYDGSISYNQADTVTNGEGGGLHITYEPGIPGGLANIYGGSIDHNQARWGGGILSYAILNIYGGSIYANTATDGAGINNARNVMNIYGGAISSNIASQSGGGIFNEKGTINFRTARIAGNTAPGGGGITNFGGIVNLDSGSIDGNVATDPAPSGGGIASCLPCSLNGDTAVVHDNTPDNIFNTNKPC